MNEPVRIVCKNTLTRETLSEKCLKKLNYLFLGILSFLSEWISTLRKSGDFDFRFNLKGKRYKALFMGPAWIVIVGSLGMATALCLYVVTVGFLLLA